MHHEFWHERWSDGRPPWDQPSPHPTLVERWAELGVAPDATVFVPLCGASVDMAWLAEQGHRVVGAELSELGVRSFFEGVGPAPDERAAGPFTVFAAGPYEIWCGDMFDLPSDVLEGVGAVYDRASLVALPADLRDRYAAFMAKRLGDEGVVFLLTFLYDPAEMSGPPFSVDVDEVRRLYGSAFDVDLLADDDVLGRDADLAARGLTALRELLMVLGRRS